MKIAYCPFDDPTTVDAIRINVRKFHRESTFDRLFREHFDTRIRMYTAGNPNVMHDVNRFQQVYVFGHGAPRADEIQAMDGTVLTIAELAARIAAVGLSKHHRTIKLFSCNGGVGGIESMASKLKAELTTTQGFKELTVYGYLESMMIGTTTTGHKFGESGARAQNIRVKAG